MPQPGAVGFPHRRRWAVLMDRLGYHPFGAQGGDWWSSVNTCIAQQHLERVVGLHLTGEHPRGPTDLRPWQWGPGRRTDRGVDLRARESSSVPALGAETICRHTALERAGRGGHFAAWEQPALFVDEVRAFFRLVR
jgi:pimeloyl-ACP methyl ester carboxylesterase